MAQIDASIPLQVRPFEAPNLLAQYANVAQIQGAHQRNKLYDLQASELDRKITGERVQGEAFAQGVGPDGKIDNGRVVSYLAQNGQGQAVPGVMKGLAEQGRAQTQAQDATFDLNSKRSKAVVQTLATARDATDLARLVAQGEAQGLFDAGMAAPVVQSAPTDPAAFHDWRTKVLMSILSPDQQMKANTPEVEIVNTGGSMVPINKNPLAAPVGPLAGAQPIARTISPDSQLSADTSRANNQASVGASYANAAATRDVAQSNRDSARIQTQFGNEQGLRKEFDNLPEVKNYKQALPAYQAVKDAVGRNTTQADINLVYGIAKLYDPNSVVREGEYATVANSPNIPERIKGYAQYLQGGGRLTPKVKQEIMAEANGRLESYQGEVGKARDSYANIARQAGIPPERVLQGAGEFRQGETAPKAKPTAPPSIDSLLNKYK